MGDVIYLNPTNELYIYTDNGWEKFSDGETVTTVKNQWTDEGLAQLGLLAQEKTKIRVHPETCSHCGAALHSNICEYCGVEYTEEANGNNT